MLKQKQRITRSVIIASIMVLVIVVGIAYAQTGLLVDHFDAATQNLAVNSGGPTSANSAGGDTEGTILGGERDATLDFISGSGAISLDINAFGENKLLYGALPLARGEAEITWDGNDNNATSLAYTGLGGADLTDSSTKDGFHVRVEEGDKDFGLEFTVYESSSLCSTAAVSETTVIGSPGISYFIPFGSFVTGTGCTGTANFANAGAITMFIDGSTETGLDLVVEFVETNTRDFGDLPASYNITTLANDGARHILGDLYLGTSVDGELDGQTGAANGDDNDGNDDEDGVVATGNWSDGSGHVDVVSTGAGCLSGWFDYDQDGLFTSPMETIIVQQPVTAGLNQFTFPLPLDVADDVDRFARFRLVADALGDGCGNDPINLTGQVYNGEVEDYRIFFSPTAVTLSDISARPQTNNALLIVAAGLLLLVGISWTVRRVRVR